MIILFHHKLNKSKLRFSGQLALKLFLPKAKGEKTQ